MVQEMWNMKAVKKGKKKRAGSVVIRGVWQAVTHRRVK